MYVTDGLNRRCWAAEDSNLDLGSHDPRCYHYTNRPEDDGAELRWGNAGLEPALDRPKRPVLTLTLIPLI